MQLRLPDLALFQIIMQVRYKRGYRYLDICGDTLCQIEATYPAWVAQNISVQSGTMTNTQEHMSLAFSAMDASLTMAKEDIESGEQFLAAAGLVLAYVVERIQPSSLDRLGIRFYDYRKYPNAQQALTALGQTELYSASRMEDFLGGKTVTRSTMFRCEDEEKGVRLNVSPVRRNNTEFNDDIKKSELLAQSSGEKSHGILFDIDYFRKVAPLPFEPVDFIKQGFSERERIHKKLAEELANV